MRTVGNKIDDNLLKKLDGKVLKEIELTNGKTFNDVRIEVDTENVNDTDVIILPPDKMSPGIIQVVKPNDIANIVMYGRKKEVLDIVANFHLRPPSQIIENLIDDLSSIKRKQLFDKALTDYLGEETVKKLSAVLSILDDPDMENGFAKTSDA